jgi:Peptidase family M28/PDZ domain
MKYVRRILAGFALAAIGAIAGPVLRAGSLTAAVDTIHAKDVQRHCNVLASGAFEGREAGSAGGQAAGAYLVDALRRLRAHPAGPDGDFYQPFPPNSRNILSVVTGSDPALRNEYILVGAHYDHVGRGNARNSLGPIGLIHYGADDNASGTAALLELVGAFLSLDVAPKRSVLFAFWDGEEEGLLGSQYWVSSPTVPLARIRFVYNIDMIGRLRQNRAEIYGCRTAPGLRRFLSARNVDSPIEMTFTWETKRDSDHYNFYAHQIPYLMIFTGKHPEYHTPYDVPEKLNVEGIERITRLLFRAVYATAQARTLPVFRTAAYQENAATQQEAETPEAPAPARLGVTWDEEAARLNRIEITGVEAGSPAEAAGFWPGDRVVEFDGVRLSSSESFRSAVFSAPQRTEAVIQRPSERSARSLEVRLAPQTEKTGLSCRTDDAEPGCLIVTRVAPGSPAARAGLKPNDRIENVARATPRSMAEFEAVVGRQKGPVEIETERDGREQVVRLILGARNFQPGSLHPSR